LVKTEYQSGKDEVGPETLLKPVPVIKYEANGYLGSGAKNYNLGLYLGHIPGNVTSFEWHYFYSRSSEVFRIVDGDTSIIPTVENYDFSWIWERGQENEETGWKKTSFKYVKDIYEEGDKKATITYQDNPPDGEE
jgi:hypothetical protein